MMSNSGSVMKQQFVAGYMAQVGTVIGYAAMPVMLGRAHETDSTGGERAKLIVLRADSSINANGTVSKQNYPEDQWGEYCNWVSDNIKPKQTRFLISSQFWTPTKDQHKQLLEMSQMKREDRSGYLSAVIGNAKNVPTIIRAAYTGVALICRVMDGIPIKFFYDNDLQGALQYMQIGERYLSNTEELLVELQEAIDRRNSRKTRGRQ